MVRVYQTAIAHDEVSPWWEPKTLYMTEFCNNNKMLPLRFTVYNYRNNGVHKQYGSVEITTRGIEMLPKAKLDLKNSKGKTTG